MAHSTSRRRAWPAVLLFVAIGGAAAFWWPPPEPLPSTGDAVPPLGPRAAPSAIEQTSRKQVRAPSHEAPASAPSPRGGDPVGGASDLRRVFDGGIGSADVLLRRAAADAFAACVPAFLAGDGDTPSPEPLIGALPPALRSEREAAYRTLYARCHGFLGQGRAPLIDLQQRLQAERQLRQPGLQAQEDLLAGRYERVDPLVAEALRAGDPAAVASLAGLASRLVLSRHPDTSDAEGLPQARAVDAALPLVACDLGLDCGVDSLGALQLCAAQGLCEGDLRARLLSRTASDGLDGAAVDAQRARLLALIRSGRGSRAVDLIP